MGGMGAGDMTEGGRIWEGGRRVEGGVGWGMGRGERSHISPTI